MNKADIVIGGIYIAKVSGKKVHVKIMNSSPHGGWEGCNIATGREVRIKTAARLQSRLLKKP